MQPNHHHTNIVPSSSWNVGRQILVPRVEAIAERPRETVYLIDSDPQVRNVVSCLFPVHRVKVVSCGSVEEYLDRGQSGEPGCLIVDMQLTVDNTADLHKITVSESNHPIIFVSDRADVVATVRAMKAGAVSILPKPINPDALDEAVHDALSQDRKRRSKQAEMAKLKQRLSLLTPREREVFPLIVGGLLNKQAASILGISEVTLQIHRSQVMRKMAAESFADLVRMALRLRIGHWRPTSSDPEYIAQGTGISRKRA